MNLIGIDSRLFLRNTTKWDGSPGRFVSALGVAIRVEDYQQFDNSYRMAMEKAFADAGLEIDFTYYCNRDFREINNKQLILDRFLEYISPHVMKVHVLYTLFSKERLSEVKVYGRKAHDEQIQLSQGTMPGAKLVSKHILQAFPLICAWRIGQYFHPTNTQFHLDSFQGHICEAYEEFLESGHRMVVYPDGDCSNPIISTADLIVEILDRRLRESQKMLIFDNIRPMLPEFGEKVLAYPLMNWDFPKITPLDDKPMRVFEYMKHPVFWFFKSDADIETKVIKDSKSYRNLVDYASLQGGVVKFFDRRDLEYFKEGDVGVYHNTRGRETIESYRKIGKIFKPQTFDIMVPK